MQQYGISGPSINSMGIIDSQEALSKELKSDIWAGFEDEFLKSTGVRAISNNWIRQPTVITSKKKLEKISDFKGVKLRIVPSAITQRVYETLGFKPTPVAYGEVYLSLQQGVIDGTIATLDAQYTMGFYEVTKYLCLFSTSCTNVCVWINDAKWQKLSPTQQKILTDICNEVGNWYVENVNKEVAGFIEKMKASGTEVITYSEDIMGEAKEMLKTVAYEYEAKGAWEKGLYDKMVEYLKTH
jgi:TRAP-type C4-dicarboxylate transport system substrate-binding protein